MAKYADTYLLCDPWRIIEEGWHRDRNVVSESIFSLGNEYMGVRGYAEEGCTAETLRGSYFNGVYEEEDTAGAAYKGIVTKTHFMVNAVDWLAVRIAADGEILDMAVSHIENFRRILDMKRGLLTRTFDWITASGADVHISFERALNMEAVEEAWQRVSFAGVGEKNADITVEMLNSFNTVHGNEKKNCWEFVKREWTERSAAIQCRTARTKQQVFSGFCWNASDGARSRRLEEEKSAGFSFSFTLEKDGGIWIEKRIYNVADKQRGAASDPVWDRGIHALMEAEKDGARFDAALARQETYWRSIWNDVDIRIEGDEANQQGIRFCIFQMYQAYHGYDSRNNIGAKGLTGEAYNGHTFWDTETYCLPFYLFSNLRAARNLLDYRYATLQQARNRAKQLDCTGACYPVATLNGEEGCNLWQHASLQFQSSTAVAYGIAHYVRISGDRVFLYKRGAEMLVEISRFLYSRGSWNNDESGFGFYAVMGPDEFHMMVNNNCYTNFMAKKTFEYTEEALREMEKTAYEEYAALASAISITAEERRKFARCAEKMIILYDDDTKLFEQHEGYFGLPHIEVKNIPAADFPLYYNWSYDRIYRTDMIKQPDVLMFLFLYNQDFSFEVKKQNYEFYEPHTIHESSLSPSIHSVFASELGEDDEAFRFFSFATRMDLDNYNRNTAEGLHTTSNAAAWVNIVYGFGGLRSDKEELVCNPVCPRWWKSYEFRIHYRGAGIRVTVEQKSVRFSAAGAVNEKIPIIVYGRRRLLDGADLVVTREERCTGSANGTS
ncbi:MAG: family 65 glycosyl hydrolase [Treponema sp.]|jgi:maltose phosphorylase|nr:family 65 glycosyl hydrolase [Treponema sp.]